MCRAITCKKCNKPTWAGCGAHVEQVLGHVPESRRCPGHESATTGDSPGVVSSIRRLFGLK
jgi:hypothetical protein